MLIGIDFDNTIAGYDRAFAAEVLAYSANKQSVVEDLIYAMRDPSSGVRNNATRALALIAMISSVVAAFLYLRIMVSAWMSDPPAEGETTTKIAIPFTSGLAIALAVGFTLAVGIFPEWLLSAAESTTNFTSRSPPGGPG